MFLYNYMAERENGKFKKGHSGNPGGKLKGDVSIVRALKRKLQDEVPSDLTNKEKRTYLEEFIELYFRKIIEKQDTKLMLDIIDRVDGKPIQKNEIEAGFTDDTKLKEVFEEMYDTKDIKTEEDGHNS